MNNRLFLLARYFRQQAELDMPDIRIDPSSLALLSMASSSGPVSLKRAPSSAPVAGGKTMNIPRPPAPVGRPTDLKTRLSSLRPVHTVVSTLPGSSPQPDPSAVAPSSIPPVANKREALKELFVAGCTKCHLAESRQSFVFGSGSAEASVMVIGEAPGKEEDEQGLPFVGAAGQLLTSMLAAIGLDRTNDVFITNILKCRPPGNRNPETSEIVTCLPLLHRQIEIIAPKAILLLGRIAAHALLEMNDSIAKMRSRVLAYNSIPVMVIYHPAALLRNAQYKRPAWEDLKQFQSLLASMDIYGSLSEK